MSATHTAHVFLFFKSIFLFVLELQSPAVIKKHKFTFENQVDEVNCEMLQLKPDVYLRSCELQILLHVLGRQPGHVTLQLLKSGYLKSVFLLVDCTKTFLKGSPQLYDRSHTGQIMSQSNKFGVLQLSNTAQVEPFGIIYEKAELPHPGFKMMYISKIKSHEGQRSF